jgi:dTDP-4-amino-4,6-dideoxygalactose transaminase
MPDLEELIPYLREIWDNKILTNSGPFHQRLEKALCDYLGVSHVSLFTNATVALVTAFQALKISGEVITTPYSFVATAHCLMWNQLKPVFVDVEPGSLNLDPARIEAAITPETRAILPVHCYGHPCQVEAIQAIADRHSLKVVYDAAHAFGVRDAGGSVLRHGDLSILSFHATKVFNTFEGGAIVCPDAETKARIDQLKNFGISDEVTIDAPGINGKMSEFNAAFGLLQLKHVDEAIARRRVLDAHYRERLARVKGIRCLSAGTETVSNHSYFPILVEPDFPVDRDALYEALKGQGIVARRYFYPLISDFAVYRNLPSAGSAQLPVATTAARQVLCLPIYPALPLGEADRIIDLIASQQVVAR